MIWPQVPKPRFGQTISMYKQINILTSKSSMVTITSESKRGHGEEGVTRNQIAEHVYLI